MNLLIASIRSSARQLWASRVFTAGDPRTIQIALRYMF